MAVAVPPMCVPNNAEIDEMGNRPRMLIVRIKKKIVQTYLTKRSVCS